MDQIKERCIYCGSDVYYTGTETLIKCGMCGHTLVVAKFENELAKMNAALEEGEQARKDLAEAEKARQDAEARLRDAIGHLDEITEGQDVLSRLMQSVMAGQDAAEDKITSLQSISERILKGQGDLFEGMNILGEIKDRLNNIGMDANATQAYAKDFITWFQDIHEDDRARLSAVNDKTSALLAEQKAVSAKIDQLKASAQKTQKMVEAFHGQYTRDKLEELKLLYHQAENYQHDRAYDKAYDKYEQIVIKGGGDAEVAWRMLLCHYCVSYQQDEHERLVPIILNPDLTAPEELSLRKDLAAQLKNVSAEQKSVYDSELSKIDRILNKYRLIRGSVAYDVFISVKQQLDGNPTRDSIAAITLYNTLTAKGLKVFNSRMTPPPAGQEYEPYIISALMSAKAMIVVGTCKENMEAQWVKNEWSRFQWLMKSEEKSSGKTDRVLLCYLAEGMMPEDIPLGLNPSRQAIKADITADKQLDQALGLEVRKEKAEKTESRQPGRDNETASQIVSQMTTWLYLGKYDKVLKKHESLTEEGLYLDQVQVHLNALCAEKKVTGLDELAESETELGKEPLFKLALRISRGTDAYNRLQDYFKKNTAWHNKRAAADQIAETARTVKEEIKETVQSSQQAVVKGEIVDSWGKIIDNIRNKTYRKKYHIGDTKILDLGDEGRIPMILAAIDTDEMADGSGKAPMTWIAGKALKTKRRMYRRPVVNDGSMDALDWMMYQSDWGESNMRSYLRTTIQGKMPGELAAHICEVKKTHFSKKQQGISTTADSIWLLSKNEIGIRDTERPETGVSYLAVFNDDNSRIRSSADSSLPTDWWLRSAGGDLSDNCFYTVGIAGKACRHRDDSENSVVFGFCLCDEPEFKGRTHEGKIVDSWDEIIASIKNNTYTKRYKIGDTKALDLGPEGIVEMQLAAFDEDELADGSEKASTTWIAKQLLKNDKRINADAKKSLFSSEYKEGTGLVGGWEKTELRVYLKDTIFRQIPSNIASNIKMVKKYTGKMNSKGWVETNAVSLENIWIPSQYEITGALSKYLPNHETTGAQYSIFKEEKRNGMMLKCRVNESAPAPWWTRSCSSTGHGSFGIVISDKISETSKDQFVYKPAGVCIGFCL